MTKILVTGATGALGGQTIRFLLDRVPASDLAVLARDPSKLTRNRLSGHLTALTNYCSFRR
jgi:uncharacterized protein YbjT (DUF2867 family)